MLVSLCLVDRQYFLFYHIAPLYGRRNISNHIFSILFSSYYYVAKGLLGGGVYVSGYCRVNSDLPRSMREFALATVSVADTFGIVVADISGLFLQSCLYQRNAIEGAVVQCPLR